MPTVLITGGTGMIGKALSRELTNRSYEVIVLTREKNHVSRSPHPGSIKYALWDIVAGTIDNDAIATADHIIHLAGASVAEKRWSGKRKQEIFDSRVQSGKLIVESLKTLPNQVKSVISISGIGYYGPDRPGRTKFIETDQPYNDFLARVCQQWESSLWPVTELGKRLVTFRTGVVLSKEGGALKEFLKPLKFGFATILGSGKQVLSWIHINDLVRLFMTAVENENYSGVYNAVSPNPVSNKEFVLALARTRNKFFISMYVPSLVLKAVLGEMSIEVLKSATVSNKKIENNGFVFEHPSVKSALNDLINKTPGHARGADSMKK